MRFRKWFEVRYGDAPDPALYAFTYGQGPGDDPEDAPYTPGNQPVTVPLRPVTKAERNPMADIDAFIDAGQSHTGPTGSASTDEFMRGFRQKYPEQLDWVISKLGEDRFESNLLKKLTRYGPQHTENQLLRLVRTHGGPPF